MTSWGQAVAANKIRLGDVLTLERIPVDIDFDAEYMQIGIRSFGNGIFHRDPCLGRDLSKLKYFEIKPGRLIVSNIMAWEGAIGISTESEKGFVGSARFLSYRPTGDVDIRFLNYYFQSSNGISLIRSTSTGTVARNQTLSPNKFEKATVPLPPLDEQCRVSDKLDAAFARIAQLSILRGRSSQLIHQYMDSQLRPIMDQVPLSAALHPSADFVNVKPDHNYRTAGILNRGRGLFHRPAISGSDTKYPRYNTLHTGQFVYSKLFGWEGSLAVVPAEFEGVHVSHEFPTFDIDLSIADVEYMSHLARWPGLHDALKDKGTGMGSRRQRVNVDRILATTVPLPSLAEQRRIARQLSVVRQATEAGAEQLAQVATLRSALLNAAFSGQL
ncbi:restriction endonuclease subunit S [Amycolatopsis sp. NPDC004747]